MVFNVLESRFYILLKLISVFSLSPALIHIILILDDLHAYNYDSQGAVRCPAYVRRPVWRCRIYSTRSGFPIKVPLLTARVG